MSFQYAYTPHIWPSILASIVVLALAIFGYRHRHMPGALPFSIACILGLLWLLGSILEFSAVDLTEKILWRKFQVIFQLPSATAITCFLLEYTWPKRWLTRRNLFILSIVPAIVIFFIVTNHIHHLLWQGFFLQDGLVAASGPLLKYFLAYVFLNFLMNLIIFGWLFVHSPQNRWAVAIMMVGQIMMRILYFINFTYRTSLILNYASIGIAFTSLMYAIVFFRFQLLGPIPVARQAIIKQLPLGIFILDSQGNILEINPVAEQMLKLTHAAVKGINIKQVLPLYPNHLSNDENGNEDKLIYYFELDDRDFRLSLSILQDWRGSQVGQLLLLEDVTAQKAAQAKILEQQRVVSTLQERVTISRELHDDLAQVFAFIKTQGQTIQRLLEKGNHEVAVSLLARLIEEADKGEVDIREAIRGMRLNVSKNSLLPTLENYLIDFEANTSIQVELIKSESFDITQLTAMAEIQLLRIVQEALTNIRKHANATRVRIIFDEADLSICVTVQDNGKGFEIKEDADAKNSHYGLLMMQERAASIGGTIHLTSQLGQGTEIIVCVPINERQDLNE